MHTLRNILAWLRSDGRHFQIIAQISFLLYGILLLGWGKEKPMKKESPKVLLMRIENSNPQPVEVSFEINFIDELRVVETSNVQTIKIGAGKAGKPKKVKLKFAPAKYNPEDVDEVDVSIEEVSRQ